MKRIFGLCLMMVLIASGCTSAKKRETASYGDAKKTQEALQQAKAAVKPFLGKTITLTLNDLEATNGCSMYPSQPCPDPKSYGGSTQFNTIGKSQSGARISFYVDDMNLAPGSIVNQNTINPKYLKASVNFTKIFNLNGDYGFNIDLKTTVQNFSIDNNRLKGQLLLTPDPYLYVTLNCREVEGMDIDPDCRASDKILNLPKFVINFDIPVTVRGRDKDGY